MLDDSSSKTQSTSYDTAQQGTRQSGCLTRQIARNPSVDQNCQHNSLLKWGWDVLMGRFAHSSQPCLGPFRNGRGRCDISRESVGVGLLPLFAAAQLLFRRKADTIGSKSGLVYILFRHVSAGLQILEESSIEKVYDSSRGGKRRPDKNKI
jgi:hypothetical protein